MPAEKSFNPYDVLGVARDADDKTIKKAHRIRAKQTHPDTKNGTAESFQEVQKAWMILSDPVQRSNYDRTGTVDENTIDNMLSAIVGIILNAIFETCRSMEQNGVDPTTQNVLAYARKTLSNQIAGFKDALHKNTEAIRKLRGVAKRMRRKSKGENLIERAITRHADEQERMFENVEQQIATLTQAISMIDEYDFDFVQQYAGGAATSYTISIGPTFVYRGT